MAESPKTAKAHLETLESLIPRTTIIDGNVFRQGSHGFVQSAREISSKFVESSGPVLAAEVLA